jgi:hypothetical protein
MNLNISYSFAFFKGVTFLRMLDLDFAAGDIYGIFGANEDEVTPFQVRHEFAKKERGRGGGEHLYPNLKST